MSGPLNRTQVWASEFSQNLSQPQQAPTHTHTLSQRAELSHWIIKKKKTFPLHLLVSPLVASKEAFRTGTTMPARSVFWFGASRYQCWIRLPLKSIHWPFFSGALTLTALNALGEVRERASLWNTGALDWSVCWAADTWCNTNLLLALQGPCALMHESHQWVCVYVCVCAFWVLVRNRLDKWMAWGRASEGWTGRKGGIDLGHRRPTPTGWADSQWAASTCEATVLNVHTFVHTAAPSHHCTPSTQPPTCFVFNFESLIHVLDSRVQVNQTSESIFSHVSATAALTRFLLPLSTVCSHCFSSFTFCCHFFLFLHKCILIRKHFRDLPFLQVYWCVKSSYKL